MYIKRLNVSFRYYNGWLRGWTRSVIADGHNWILFRRQIHRWQRYANFVEIGIGPFSVELPWVWHPVAKAFRDSEIRTGRHGVPGSKR